MQVQHVEFDTIDFKDIKGTYRTIRQCPLTQREEFRTRLGQLQEQLQQRDGSETIAEAFDRDPYFAYLCQECLTLCGIAPNWLSIDMLVTFLFPHEEEGKIVEGVLVQINFPKSKRVASDKDKGMNYEELLASLWSYTQDLSKALELAKTVPGSELLGILDARAQQLQDANPEEREKAIKREWQSKAREEMEALTRLAHDTP